MTIKRKHTLFFLSLTLIIILLIGLSYRITVLTLENTYTHKKYVLYYLSSVPTILSIKFLHSYDKDEVIEVFSIIHGLFKPIKVVYSSDSYDYREWRYNGTIMVNSTRIVLLINNGPQYNELFYQIAYLAPQELTITSNGERRIFHLQWFGKSGEAIKLRVERIPYLTLLYYMLKGDFYGR